MNNSRNYKSCLAKHMKSFLEQRELMHMATNTTQWSLKSFDDYLSTAGINCIEITEDTVNGWIDSFTEIKSTSKSRKISDIRVFFLYLSQQGVQCFIPRLPRVTEDDFVPYIFSHDEMTRLFEASNNLVSRNYRHDSLLMAIPALLRLLYSTGIRIGEALSIRNEDVNFERHLIVINRTKNHCQRLAPINESLEEVLKTYISYRNRLPFRDLNEPMAYLFVTGTGKKLTPQSVDSYFKKLLSSAQIPYIGDHNGPRIHDLRHTACVHAMAQLVKEGKDIYCCLPMLATFMGHKNVTSTEHYVRLTKEMFPDLITKDSVMTSAINNIIKKLNKDSYGNT